MGASLSYIGLHEDQKVQVFHITYADQKNVRPLQIMELAKIELAQHRGYNAYIDSGFSELWSRLIIFGINDMPQHPFNGQKL